MKKNINSYLLKLSGTCEIPSELNDLQNLKVIIDGQITTETFKDNNDGTYDCIYKYKPILVEYQEQSREVMRARDTRSASELQRNQLLAIHRDKNIEMEFDKFYDLVMQAYRHNADKIVNDVLAYHKA